MRSPTQPAREQLTLAALMHSLSDPTRLEIVRMLSGVAERSCGDFHDLGGVTVPTLSHHLRVLREAGVTDTRIEGRNRYVSLRRDDLDARFPGVLEPIVAASASVVRNG